MKLLLTVLLLFAQFLTPTLAQAIPFQNLEKALHYYERIRKSEGWLAIGEGPKLEKGLSDLRVVPLREHLFLTKDLEEKEAMDPDFFDESLEKAVQLFQKRHGLTEDGVVGVTTLQALNIPVETRIRQIEAAIQREKEPQPIPEGQYVLVNIPAFHLDYFENKKPVLGMSIIVGKRNWETPIFTSNITGITFNPTWNIPASIVKREILSKIKKDPDYLTKEEIEVTENRYQQKPGPKNPLGRIKFVMPNEFDVYLHDTPAKNFFARPMRHLSHGCIRIEKPLELAELLLRADPRWTLKKIRQTIDEGKEITILLPAPVPVNIIYQTVWLDEAGLLQFRTDIYGRD
ncbi:MAG: L,D-transpeptidase family protein [Deltaproteobacteria bacterium]|nr:L,D-transpeptidase family protein [Deltaproteobacteria bacterium]